MNEPTPTQRVEQMLNCTAETAETNAGKLCFELATELEAANVAKLELQNKVDNFDVNWEQQQLIVKDLRQQLADKAGQTIIITALKEQLADKTRHMDACRAWLNVADDETLCVAIEQLRTENVELKKDQERLDATRLAALKATAQAVNGIQIEFNIHLVHRILANNHSSGTTSDAAIDAARKEQG